MQFEIVFVFVNVKIFDWICRGYSNFVNCIRFFFDGSKFLLVGLDKNGFFFNGKIGEKIGEFFFENGYSGSIYVVSWSFNGKQVEIKLFDVDLVYCG